MTRRRSILISSDGETAVADNCNWQAREAESMNNSMFTYWFSRTNRTANNTSPPTAVSPSSPPSYDAYQNRRSAFELTRMHSNDSLNSDRHYAKSIDSSSNIPPSAPYASSPPRHEYSSQQATVAMSSPIMARRELSNPHQMVPPQPQVPAYHPHQSQPQLLVDPNTGQQYYFPTAPQPQYYYPLVPATPVYYHQPPQGYIVASQAQPVPAQHQQGQPPQSPTHPRAMFFHHPPTSFNSSYGNAGYFVEHPPSSNVSVCGQPEPEYFQRNQGSRHSVESGSSGSTRHGQLRRRNSRDSMSSSPAPSTVAPPVSAATPVTSFAQMPASVEPSSPSHQTLQMGGKFSTTSSCTSGFASGTGESLADHSNNSFNTSLITTRQRPVWWGTTETTTRIGLEEKLPSPTRNQRILTEKRSTESEKSPSEEKTPTLSAPSLRREVTPPEATLGRSSPPETSSEPPQKPVQKAIRMDIDFNAPVENAEKEKTPPKLASNRSSATAFTVTFDNEVAPKKSVSLQDAAKKAPTNRRMMRRSAPTTANKKEDSESEHQDPKHYLFNKMIQGFKDSPGGELEVPKDLKDDFDTLSEAGTYVVDTRSRSFKKYADTESSDDSGDESASTISETPYSSAPSSARQPQVPETKLPPPRQSLLASRLQQLRDRSNAPVSTKAAEPAPSTSSKPSPPIRPCRNQPAASTSTNFRRGDGGRFSMRAGPTSSSAPFNPPSTRNSAGSRPVARAPTAGAKKPPPPVVKDTPEMVAWLRRKEYDPRKSAAEARKIQQLKTRENAFQQNRSISFHPGASQLTFKRLQRDQRSNKSHDDLSHVGEDDEASGQSNELEKQVDALTQKCLKSIQLIKICNQNTLSESVENLLERVVQPTDEDEPQPNETVSDQLQRLSSAFDAIQKYFEEQRSGSVSPPSFRHQISSPRPRTVGTSRSPPTSRRQPFH